MKFLKSKKKDIKPICVVIGDDYHLNIGDSILHQNIKYRISRISKLRDMCYNDPDINIYILFGTEEV